MPPQVLVISCLEHRLLMCRNSCTFKKRHKHEACLMVCVLQVVGKGLSALTEALLATPLDKTLQCSTWGLRPLTQAQVLPLLCGRQPVSLMKLC